MSTLKIAKYQLQDVVRSRWILFYGLFFLVATDALFRFGGTGERVVLSLMNVVLVMIPLVSVVLGAMYLYSAREYIELLLAQPIRRGSLFPGLFAGLALPLCGAFVAGWAAVRSTTARWAAGRHAGPLGAAAGHGRAADAGLRVARVRGRARDGGPDPRAGRGAGRRGCSSP
jgi:hypothetical protein